jgi:nucleotide-binding universal stress UspA family protein
MTYTAILVQSEPGAEAEARLKCAADLADRFGAVLIGLGAQKPLGIASVELLGAIQAEWLIAMRDQVEADLRAAEQAFHDAVGSRRALWKTRRARPGTALAEAARCADLIVVGGASRDQMTNISADLCRLLLTAGRPVLVAPPAGAYLNAERIVVAWKDGREARRAVADALPLLQRAKDVLIVGVADQSHCAAVQEALAEVASALGLHGVAARAEVVEGREHETVQLLAERARWSGADLIVAGAYGHSRAGEILLGGVTEALLDQREFFVLFSH